jgi:O-antigen/teichoic acid export membrane protein
VSTKELVSRALPGAAPDGPLPVAFPTPTPVQPLTADGSVAKSGLSLRSNFTWILIGNVVYAACQWGAIVALAKLGNSYMIGQFSLGLAIATPVLMLTNLNLRVVQATDARHLYSFGEYLWLRSAMTLSGLAIIAGIAGFGNYTHQTAMVIVAVALAKGVETLSDIHYGLFQLNDRLDQSGRSMMLRGILSVTALAGVLWLTRSIVWACVSLASVWLAALVLFDVRQAQHFLSGRPDSKPGKPKLRWNLLRTAVPLGVATTIAALNLNMPRYFIHARLGERELGIYSAMAYATVAMVLVSDSLGHCAVPRLSRLYSGGRLDEYRSLLLKMLAAGASLGLSGLAAARLFGVRMLGIVYGKEYAAHSQIFWVLIVATAIYCVASMFTSAITSARCFRIQIPLYGLVVGANALACAHWVPVYGLAGGAAAMVVAAMTHLLLGAAVVGYLLWTPARRPACSAARPQACVTDWEAGL